MNRALGEKSASDYLEAVVEMVLQTGWRQVRVDAVRQGAGTHGA
jgi:hypothetical protein